MRNTTTAAIIIEFSDEREKKKKSFCLVLVFYLNRIYILVCKAPGIITLCKVLNPFIPIPKNEGREE